MSAAPSGKGEFEGDGANSVDVRPSAKTGGNAAGGELGSIAAAAPISRKGKAAELAGAELTEADEEADEEDDEDDEEEDDEAANGHGPDRGWVPFFSRRHVLQVAGFRVFLLGVAVCEESESTEVERVDCVLPASLRASERTGEKKIREGQKKERQTGDGEQEWRRMPAAMSHLSQCDLI